MVAADIRTRYLIGLTLSCKAKKQAWPLTRVIIIAKIINMKRLPEEIHLSGQLYIFIFSLHFFLSDECMRVTI